MSHSPQKPVLGYVFVLYSLMCLVLAFGLSHRPEIAPSSPTVTIKPAPKPASSIAKATPHKQRFYDRMLPAIQRQNDHIREQRQQLLAIKQRLDNDQSLTDDQQATLNQWSEDYRAENALEDPAQTQQALVAELMKRIDVVPASMALAQGAMESAWGRSRFAREANNYFGQWCFTQGCGVVPKRRPADASHEVARFASIDAAVAAYLRNINSHPAYEEVRQIRASSRARNQPLDSLAMAQGLEKYSAKGHQYILDLQGMIRFNKLKQFDYPQPIPQDMAQQEEPASRS